MSKLIVTDDLWELVESLIPRHEPSPKGGRKPVDDRVCLTGILFVLKTGIAWEDFPQEMGCCGMTLWNRLHDWMKAGGVGGAARVALVEAAPGGRDRLVACHGRLGQRPRGAWRKKKPGPVPWIVPKRAPSTTC